jgi:pre-mRNA-processing factor 8
MEQEAIDGSAAATAAGAAPQVTTTTTKSVNVHGEEIVVSSQSPYEQATFTSKTEWRIRALGSTSLSFRANNLFINNPPTEDDDENIFVLPRNLVKKFITISDLRTQIGAFMYGKSPADNPRVKEIWALVMVPQVGNHLHVSMPQNFPEDFSPKEYFDGLEPLGWLHTLTAVNNSDTARLAPYDCITTSRMLSENRKWSVSSSIVITCAFQPGCCLLTGNRLTPIGLKWGRDNSQVATSSSVNPAGFDDAASSKQVQLILTDTFSGFWMTTDSGVWNYNFNAVKHQPSMDYRVHIDVPVDFYDPRHRKSHFLHFTNVEESGFGNLAEVEDNLA